MHPHLLSHLLSQLRRACARTAGRLAALALSGCGGGDQPSAPGFSSIGGTVSGLSGNVLVLLNGADAMTLSANGSFVFANPLPQGSLYAVTVASQPSGQLCTVGNAVGTVSAAVRVLLQ
jgi:hypothetical protein